MGETSSSEQLDKFNSKGYPKFFGSGRYALDQYIAKGNHGTIFACTETSTGKKFAAKFEDISSESHIRREYSIYKKLGPHPGISQVFYFGKENRKDLVYANLKATLVLVLELLGPSVEDLLAEGKLSLKQALRFTAQMLSILERLHREGYQFNLFKTDSFLVNIERTCVKLVDFGRTKLAREYSGFVHEEGYTSYDQFFPAKWHTGEALSQGGEIESLGFFLLLMLSGQMPWGHSIVRDFRMTTEKIKEYRGCYGEDIYTDLEDYKCQSVRKVKEDFDLWKIEEVPDIVREFIHYGQQSGGKTHEEINYRSWRRALGNWKEEKAAL